MARQNWRQKFEDLERQHAATLDAFARVRVQRDEYYTWWQQAVRGGFGPIGERIPAEVSEALRHLGLSLPVSVEAVNGVRKRRALIEHPDRGGSELAMQLTNACADRLIQHIESKARAA